MYTHRNCKGMALKDLLSILATLAIGASIGVPALSRSREAERSAACQANLRRLGYGITMYVADQAGSLPGPTTTAIPYNCGPVFLNGTQAGSAYYKAQITSYLAPYLVDEHDRRAADQLAFCPTADAIPVASSWQQAWYYRTRSYYLLNNTSSTERSGNLPYYGTKPRYYFGYVNVGTPVDKVPAVQLPKKLADVANPSKEWSSADLWYWIGTTAGGRGLTRPVGTWPYLVTSDPSTIASGDGLKVPSYPFHMTSRSFPAPTTLSIIPNTVPNTPRLASGRTNAVYFDGHTESVQNWRGSVNPCFDQNNDQQCD